MAKVKIQIHKPGIVEALQSAPVESALMDVGEASASVIRASAPVDSGEFQNSISVFSEMHSDRVVVHVSSDAPHAMAVEARTGVMSRSLGG